MPPAKVLKVDGSLEFNLFNPHCIEVRYSLNVLGGEVGHASFFGYLVHTKKLNLYLKLTGIFFLNVYLWESMYIENKEKLTWSFIVFYMEGAGELGH